MGGNNHFYGKIALEMQVFNNFFEILLAPMEPKNLILLNFPKKAYHAHPPPHPHSEEYSPMPGSQSPRACPGCRNPCLDHRPDRNILLSNGFLMVSYLFFLLTISKWST